MKKILLILILTIPTLLVCCNDDKGYEYDYTPKTIEYKIINKTNRNYDITSISYEYKTRESEADVEIILSLKPEAETIILKTKYKYLNILCSYEKDMGEGKGTESKFIFYPNTSSFFELKEAIVNIIELN